MQINKPASNNRRILIAAVFHFVAAAEEHKDEKLEMLKDSSCSPP